jgi:hypothetical protein
MNHVLFFFFFNIWVRVLHYHFLNFVKFNGRFWKTRRVIWTKDVIAIVKTEEEVLIDAIPLAEVKSIIDMNTMDPEGTEVQNNKSSKRGAYPVLAGI